MRVLKIHQGYTCTFNEQTIPPHGLQNVFCEEAREQLLGEPNTMLFV
jgi:hypothetical protein